MTIKDADLRVENLSMEDIHMDNDFNCRGIIPIADVKQLADNIASEGLLQPVIVMEYDENMILETGFKYLLVIGYRRYSAHKLNNAETIQAKILKTGLTINEARIYNLTENIQRKDLDFMQEAGAIKQIMQNNALTEQEVMRRLGQGRGWVQVRMMALKLPTVIQAEIAAGIVKQADIRDIYKVFRKEGADSAIEVTRELKIQKERGGRPSAISVRKKSPNSKRHRRRGEIFDMQEHIQEFFENSNRMARVLAWAAGEISNIELVESLKLYASQDEIEYSPMDME